MLSTAAAGANAPSIESLVDLATRQSWPAVLRPENTARYLGISKKRLYDILRDDPNFPRQIRFSERCVGWSRTSIDAWIAARERQGGVA